MKKKTTKKFPEKKRKLKVFLSQLKGTITKIEKEMKI
jgi:hypothetical protein